MNAKPFINILIAEDNDVSRDMMSGILKTKGYSVHGAINAESAIKVTRERDIDLALVDVNMSPKGGFDFARYILSQGLKIPIVFITGDDSADLLMEATAVGVKQVIQKPIQPDRLVQTVERMLKRHGVNPNVLAVEKHESKHSPEDLMQRAIDLAAQNAADKKGGPFGAVLASADGEILGEGVNGGASRIDPIAHAEVMAIRRAADKQGRDDFSDCVLYCSAQPTRIGAALIESVGIKKVYFGLSHEDVGLDASKRSEPDFEPLLADKALAMFKAAKA